MRITEQALQDLEWADEYSLRHLDNEVIDLTESYRHLVYLLEDAGVLQLDEDWAKRIQDHVSGVIGEEMPE
jgi:hypothetical protein